MSKRSILNFQTTARDQWLGHASTQSSRALAAFSLTVAVAFLVVIGMRIFNTRNELSAARATLEQAQLVELTRNRPAHAKTAQLTKQQISAYNTVVRQLNTPWTGLFDTLERSASQDVALVLIEPDSVHAIIRIQAEAKKMDDLLNYAEAVRRDTNVGNVSLVKQETNERDPNRPVRLTLEARIRVPNGQEP